MAFLFLDGVGIGERDQSFNPFFAAGLSTLPTMFGNFIPCTRQPEVLNTHYAIRPLDATMGVDGLPQSGTGQTALFTGINAAQYVGKHFGPYPYSTLRPLIARENIFRKIRDAGMSFCFANAYPKQFFDYINAGKRRLTVTTMACLESNLPLHTADDLRNATAISADITNERWKRLGYFDIPEIAAEEAGRRFAALAEKHTFTLFEYFLTDHAGHRRDMDNAVMVLRRLDKFLAGFRETVNDSTLLVITSDHGNVEDLRVKTHTRNAVPLWVYGEDAKQFVDGISSITDLAHKILRWLNVV